MKRITLTAIVLVTAIAAMAQDNKPLAGNFGIGYDIGFFPVQQNVLLTYMVTNNLEVGGTVGFQVTRTRNSTFDSLEVLGTGFTYLPGQQQNKTVTTTASVFITPMVKYHFNVKSNLDLYVGGFLPIGVAPGNKTVTSSIVTASDYNNTGATTVTAPVSVTIGAGVILGCQYFVYKNLALGASANLGFSATVQNGNDVTVISETNTGSNNLAAGTSVPSTTTKQEVKNDTEGAGMLHNFDLNVTWYFEKGIGKK